MPCEVVIGFFLSVVRDIRQYGMTVRFDDVAGTVIFELVQLASRQPCLAVA
ncbi:hypothetical protein ACR715_17165 [Xenorhabdus bovienii]